MILERIEGGKVGILDKETDIEVTKERGTDFSDTVFGITHTGNTEEVEQVKQELIRLFQPKDIIVNYMGATMGTYAGEDGMIISF